MPEHRTLSLVLRLSLCLATSAAISITAYLCAWQEYRNYVAHYDRPAQTGTRHFLESLRAEIERHREAVGKLPASLAELDVVKNREIRVNDAWQPTDGWGRPIGYEIEEGGYRLYSLGRDGLPGGSGEDADLFAGKMDETNETLTLWEFMTSRGTQGILSACILAGVLAFPLCLLGVRKTADQRLSLVRVLFIHGLTAFFAILTALAISAVHLPSGH